MELTPLLGSPLPSKPGRALFLGIKGVGMLAAAILLQDQGWEIDGQDVAEVFHTDALIAARQIRVKTFSERLPHPLPDLVVRTGAHQELTRNQIEEAKGLGILVLTLAQLLGQLSEQKTTIAVAGVGGKTTTSSWLAWLLTSAKLKPSYAVGVGKLQNLPSPARWQEGKYLVVEADEYVADPQSEAVPKLLFLTPQHVIVTALSFDHPDVYRDAAATKQVFATFLDKLHADSNLVINGDDLELVRLARQSTARVITVGFGADNDWRIVRREVHGEEQTVFIDGREDIAPVKLQLPGAHHAWNWLAAAVMARSLGVDWETLIQGGFTFTGVARRWERHGTTRTGTICFDDYAHHPRELERLAETLQECFIDRQVVSVFQPHTYSRTAALRSEFVAALAKFPGKIYLYPVFASARESAVQATVESQDLVTDLQERGVNAGLISSLDEVRKVRDALPSGSVFFTIGAGILDRVHDE